MGLNLYRMCINLPWIIRGAWCTFFYNTFRKSFKIGKRLRVQSGREWIMTPGCKVSFGNNVFLGKNVSINSTQGGNLEIGDNVGIGNNSQIVSRKHIRIGHGTSLAPGVMMFDHNHKFDLNTGVNQREFDEGEIFIGENCWLGANVIVLKDVVIGNNTIIGAGSVVVKDIPDCCVAVGNPCKPIKFLK